MLTKDTRLSPCAEAISAEVGGEVVLLNTSTGYFHQLNASGSYLWKRIEEAATFESLCAGAVADFEADAEACQRDVLAFLEELEGKGLVRIE